MDHISEISVFVQAARYGSFSAAARALDLSPSAVSKQVRRLEDRLGVRLFNRTTRKMSLTEAGRSFHQSCVRIMQELEEAEEAAGAYHQAVRGTLRVSATAAFTRINVLPHINEFLEQHPDLDLQLELTDRSVDVVAEGLDVTIRLAEQLEDPSLVARRLVTNERIVCASPDYLARHGMPKTPEDLLRHNCLTMYTLADFNDWAFEDEKGRRVIHVNGNFHANTGDALAQAVVGGVGLARLSAWLVADALQDGRLVHVLPEYPHSESAFYVLYPQGRYVSRKVRVFVDWLVELFANKPSPA
ncbi:LysR family transcriptional regulator [Alkalilimnicola sp. S0819]|uniref:LysR family transcriptional regulator n=1 Tax=Alkalilimnicola sp. S0819 TaxID=2613922 RepID=UPI001261AF2C|nr:LysR family transcriptional regulator [Alkalilimnicola sp. S0819]KAB7623924.1 LysR family transcriptional regulator [Alkalilimnicola sp. S0819]MPQ16521.1 LysR family transcriptional regulator [Alkalilimnicola sp. S0819]